MAELVKRIEDATDGQVTLDVFYLGEHPYKVTEVLKPVSSRSCDLSLISHAQGGDEPRMNVNPSIPFFIPNVDLEIDKAVVRFMAERGVFQDIFDDWNCRYLMSGYYGKHHVFMRDNLITRPDDLKGKTVRAGTSLPAITTLQLLGAEPVAIAWGELYTALSTGLVDGFKTNIGGAFRGGMTEIAPYILWAPSENPSVRLVVNKDSLAELPSDLQDDLISAFKDMEEWFMNGTLGDNLLALEQSLHRDGAVVNTMSPEWREQTRARAWEVAWNPIVETAGSEGYEIFNVMVEALKAQGFDVPGYTPK
ncbi:MAG: hypothetical protein CL874_05340 [Dehalococcoidales bacterium]|jgi:TRAP-type C4-dicarboxylate transport system substrate-binding protein|nr:hypothetical protein [Dehalococcoidales bacterium]